MKDSRKLPGVHVVAGTPDSSLAARELNFLVRLAQAAASTQRPDELLELIIRETTSAIGTDVCSLYLLTTPGRQLLLTATNGLNENMIGKVTMKVGEGITGWVAESRRPAVVPDVSKEPHWKWVPGLDEDRFHSMASVPIESGPRLVGVINVQSTERREFNSGDIDFLRAIAGQVAGILERSELQRRTEVQLAEISLSHDIHERFTKLSLEGAGITFRRRPAASPVRFGSRRAARRARWTWCRCAPGATCWGCSRWASSRESTPRAASGRSSTARRCWPSSWPRSARRQRSSAGCAATWSKRSWPAVWRPRRRSGSRGRRNGSATACLSGHGWSCSKRMTTRRRLRLRRAGSRIGWTAP
ncbi:MAG: GAF domain-containing protein [Chloroflexi bacterium]|nr:MAG: GAF domain-containing protein [Chloroflexota bacterium]